MDSVKEKYLELLKAALWGGNELTSEGLTSEGVNEVIRLAAFQGTVPLVYDQLLKMPEVEIPAELRMQMKQQCVSNMMQQQNLKQLKQTNVYPHAFKSAKAKLINLSPRLAVEV